MATAVTYTPTGRSRRPFIVANFNAIRQCCTINDWDLDWTRRNQFVPHGQNTLQEYPAPDLFGGYVLNFLNIGDDTIIRSVIQQTTDYSYTSAQQIEDHGALQTSIRVEIAQIDRIVGTGYTIKKTFTA